ncbi:hypothetical protein ONS96_000093 [Cadophora gregata f. sp. sojae]|nr:hypothetical protein ONS96_000093 [Cadophora gregata f. sp. sojae]
MSDLEEIQLVLEGFSLLSSTAEDYKQGFENLPDWKRLRTEFIGFVNSIDIEKQLYGQMLERFLDSTDMSQVEVQGFVTGQSDLDHYGRQRGKLADLLRSRLGSSYAIYMSTTRSLNEVIIEMQDILSSKNGKINWADNSSRRWEIQMERIWLNISKTGRTTLTSLGTHCCKLRELLEPNEWLQNTRVTRSNEPWGSVFESIRQHASSLHSALQSYWTCDCPTPHIVDLQLKRRTIGGSSSIFDLKLETDLDIGSRRHISIRLMVNSRLYRPLHFNAPSSLGNLFEQPHFKPGRIWWEDDESRGTLPKVHARKKQPTPKTKAKKILRLSVPEAIPVRAIVKSPSGDSNPPDHVGKNVYRPGTKNLCSPLRRLITDHPACLEDLAGGKQRSHELIVIEDRFDLANKTPCVSLETLLRNGHAKILTRHQRHEIASILASSLLQLQTTPWLTQTFGKQDILFYNEDSAILFDKPFLRHPFTSIESRQAISPAGGDPPTARLAARTSLFNLGIVLLEICYGQAIEDQPLRESYLGSEGNPHEYTDFMTARDWAEHVGEQEPEWVNIIRCCLSCMFEEKADWSNKRFTAAVYTTVVEPLENMAGRIAAESIRSAEDPIGASVSIEDALTSKKPLPMTNRQTRKTVEEEPQAIENTKQLQAGYYDRGETMLALENQIRKNLMLSHEPTKALFRISWDPRDFMTTQYDPHDALELGSVIIISGSALQCQAVTVSDYLKQNWATHGEHVLQALESVLASPEIQGRADINYDCSVIVSMTTPNVVEVQATGSLDDVVAITQIFAWLGAAVRKSATPKVQYSECILTSLSEGSFDMDFVQAPLAEPEKMCWFSLFANPVIAKGFPIPPRTSCDLGIEIPLEMMAFLIGAEHAVEHGCGLVIKGFSSVLIPVKRCNNSVQWHLVSKPNGTRMKYSDISDAMRLSLRELDQDSLGQTRAFLGWWRHSESYLGTRNVVYGDISPSKAERVSRKINMTDVTVGFSKGGSATTKFAIGARESRYVSRAGRLEPLLDAGQEMRVCLYDFASKRSWFASGTEVLLYLVHIKHQKRPYVMNGERVDLEFANPAEDGSGACRTALMSMASVPIYGNTAISSTNYYVQDLVNQLWLRLEKIEEPKDEAGISIDLMASQKLTGYELMDLAFDKGVLKQREVRLQDTSGKWLDMIKACDGVVLFGSHLGDLIRPATETRGLCPGWSSLPEGKDYMAMTSQSVFRVFGEADDEGHLRLFDLRLHKSSLLFESCSGSRSHCSCQRTLQIVRKRKISWGMVNPPGNCGLTGCVIIGRTRGIHKSQKHSSNFEGQLCSSQSSNECNNENLVDEALTTSAPEMPIPEDFEAALRASGDMYLSQDDDDDVDLEYSEEVPVQVNTTLRSRQSGSSSTVIDARPMPVVWPFSDTKNKILPQDYGEDVALQSQTSGPLPLGIDSRNLKQLDMSSTELPGPSTCLCRMRSDPSAVHTCQCFRKVREEDAVVIAKDSGCHLLSIPDSKPFLVSRPARLNIVEGRTELDPTLSLTSGKKLPSLSAEYESSEAHNGRWTSTNPRSPPNVSLPHRKLLDYASKSPTPENQGQPVRGQGVQRLVKKGPVSELRSSYLREEPRTSDPEAHPWRVAQRHDAQKDGKGKGKESAV